MTAATYSHRERLDLAALLLALGPAAPTLCAGWNAADLAAHLVIRESRPDAALGILGGPLANWTQHVQDATANLPYAELVAKVRNGPPPCHSLPFQGLMGSPISLNILYITRICAGAKPIGSHVNSQLISQTSFGVASPRARDCFIARFRSAWFSSELTQLPLPDLSPAKGARRLLFAVTLENSSYVRMAARPLIWRPMERRLRLPRSTAHP